MTDGFAMFAANAMPVGRARCRGRGRGVEPVPADVQRAVERQAPRDDGRQPDRPLRQPELRLHRRLAQAQGPAARLPGRAGQHHQPHDLVLDPEPLAQACSSTRSTWCAASGYDRAAELGPVASRFHEIRRVVTNLASSTSRRPTTACGCARCTRASPSTRSSRPPASSWSIDDVGRRDPGADRRRAAAHPRGPRPERHRARPRCEGEAVTGSSHHAALHTRVCELFGVEYPIVQTGMGWVAGARLTSATADGRRSRHPGLGHHDPRPSCARPSARSRTAPTRTSASTCAPTSPTSATASTCSSARGEGGVVRAGAEPRHRRQAQGRRHRHHADRRRPAPRREGGRVGRRRRHRPGRRGRRPHRHRADLAAAARRWSTRSTSRCSAPAASPTVVAWWPRWPGARAASPWAPGSCSPRSRRCPTS